MVQTEANARSADGSGPFYRRIVSWLAGFEDGAIMRVAFFALLFGTLSVLYLDYKEMAAADGQELNTSQTVLPPFNPGGPTLGPSQTITTDPSRLQAPLTISLMPGGVLALTGTIDIGAAARFREEVAARGEYVDTVTLDSPGGSVMDALALGAVIRENGYATLVAAGSLCASSCPIVFAGGTERFASSLAVIGVHQIYAEALSSDHSVPIPTASVALADAQSVTAQITRFLSSTGVDPALWLHALETAPDRLYYLSTQELQTLHLATTIID